MDAVWVDVLPAMGTFAKDFVTGATKAGEDAGRSSGTAWGKAFGKNAGDSGTTQAAAEIEKNEKRAKKAVDDATAGIGLARAAQREASARVLLAEQALADAVAKGGQDSAKAEAATLRLEAARDKQKVAADKVERAEIGLKASIDEQKEAQEQATRATDDGAAAASDASGKWGGFEGSLAKVAGALGLVVAGAAGLAAGFTGAMDLSTGVAKVEAALGLTVEQSAVAGSAAGSLYSDSYGESMGDVQVGVEAVMSSLDGMRDASEADLQAVTGQAMSLAGAFDLDVQEAVTAAGGLIKNGLAPDATGAFDLITASLQQVPAAMRGDVLDAANEYGGVFSSLGLSGSQSLGMLASASDGGVIAIDKVGDSLKEFTIRATDMSTGSVAAYDALGLNAEQMSNRLLAGGATASGAMSEIVGELMAIKDPAEQANTAIALFGTPLEDLGVSKIPEFLGSLSAMDSGLGDVTGKAGELDEAMAGTVDPIESLKRSFGGALTDALTPFAGWVTDVMPGVQDLFSILFEGNYTGGLFESFGIAEDSAIVDFLFDVRDGVMGFASYMTETAIPALQDFGGWVVDNKDGIAAFGVGIGVVTTGLALMKANAALAAAGGLKQLILSTNTAKAAQAGFNLVMNANPIGLIVTAIAALVGGLVYFFTQTETGKAAWETFTTAIGTAWDWVVTKLGEGWTWVQDNVFEPVKTGIGWVGEKFVELKDGAVGAWNTMKDGLKAGWDFVYLWVISPYILGAQWVWDKFVAVKDGVVGAWNLVRDGLGAGWSWVRDNVFAPVKTGVADVGDKFNAAKTVMTGAWDTVKTSVSGVWDWIRDNVFNNFSTGVAAIGTAFEGARDTIKTAWNQLGNIARAPINFIVDTVYNNGVKAVFDDIAQAVGLNLSLPTAATVPEFKAATGGIMPGYTPGQDVHHFTSPTGGLLHLSGGEPILRPEAGRVLGASWVHGINAAARTGGTSGVESFLGRGVPQQSFFLGGLWDNVKNVAGNVGEFVSNAASSAKDMVLNVAGFLSNPAEGFRSLVTAPMESLLSTVMSGDLGKMLVEVPRKTVTGIIDKALNLIGLGSGPDGGLPDMMAGGGWARPSRGRITSAFGPRWGAFHNGTDFAGGGATYAAGAGKVSRVGWNVGRGNTGIGIMLDHGNGLETYYGHNPSLSAVRVGVGDTVRAGQHIGQEGATGNVTGVHLHWSAFRNGKAFNPMSLLGGGGGGGGGGRGASVYDSGGMLNPGDLGVNLSNKPEVVFTDPQWQAIRTLADLEDFGSRSRDINLTIHADSVPLAQEIASKSVAKLASALRAKVGG